MGKKTDIERVTDVTKIDLTETDKRAAYELGVRKSRDDRSARVVQAIANLVDKVRESKRNAIILEQSIAHNTKKLDALREGRFVLGLHDEIVFDDKSLNVDTVIVGKTLVHL